MKDIRKNDTQTWTLSSYAGAFSEAIRIFREEPATSFVLGTTGQLRTRFQTTQLDVLQSGNATRRPEALSPLADLWFIRRVNVNLFNFALRMPRVTLVEAVPERKTELEYLTSKYPQLFESEAEKLAKANEPIEETKAYAVLETAMKSE